MAEGAASAFTRYASNFSGREVRLIRVGKSVASSFRQISDAIRHSRPHDRIEVESGRYFEALAISHPVELCSAEDGETPVIISRGPCLKINTDGPVLVQNFSIVAKGTTTSGYQGILIEHGSPVIRDCEISSVYVINDATPRILHCHIRDSDSGYGLSITGSSGGVYVNNNIGHHNEQCVYINTKGKPELRQNIISQKQGQKNVAVLISGRLCGGCEPTFCENIIRGGGEATSQEQVDSASVHFPQMLYEDNSGEWASLVGVLNGATPCLTGNLLCNGVTGFYFRDCSMPKEHFCNNRVISCSAWGLVVGKNASLVSLKNDVQTCGGGILVSSTAACNVTATDSYSVALKSCELFRNFHYGILVDRAAVAITQCSVFEGSVGIALLGNCAASTIKNNTLNSNRVAAFCLLRRGVASIEENIIRGCKNGMYGVFLQEGSNMVLRSNLIEGTSTSVFLREESCIVAEKNALRESSVHHVVITGRSKAKLQGNTIEGSSYASVVVTNHSECEAIGNVMYAGLREGILVEEKGSAIFQGNSMSSFRETMYVKTGGSLQAKGNDVTLSHHGVVVEGEESHSVVINNHFRGMSAMAVYALERATVTVEGNSMTEFSAVSIQVGSGAVAVIEKNSFTNGSDGAIHVDGVGTQCKVLHCEMEGVGYGVMFTSGSTGVIQENQIRLCARFGVACKSNSPVTVHGNTISAANVGIDIYAAGDIYDNVIEDGEVGILANALANAQVRNHRLVNCTVGIHLMNDTCVNFTAIKIQRPKEFGVVVNGPSANVTVSNMTVEDCGMAGVFVQKGGVCRFEECVIRRSKEDGIRMERAGAVVFEQCSILEQHRGVKATGALGAAQNEGEPKLINCTIDGSLCEEGVLSENKSIVRLELCKISARSPEKGRGVVVRDGGTAFLSRCDVSGCPRAGVVVSAMSQLMVEHSTVDGCGVGVCFGLEQDRLSSRHSLRTSNKAIATIMSTGVTNPPTNNSTTWTPPTLSQMTIKGCTEAGIWFESCGLGVVNCTTVAECAKGVVLHRGCTVRMDSTVVRGSVSCGVLLLGRPSSNSVLTHLTISDSGDCGVKVDRAVDADEEGEGGGKETRLTIQNSEVLRNAKGGVVLEACAYFERCTFAHNAQAGVVCGGNSRPVLSGCHLMHNAEMNLEAQFGSMPELHDCLVEHAPVGVRVTSVVKMTRCIAQHLGLAVDFRIGEKSSDVSQLLKCVIASNETGVSCAGGACEGTWNQIVIEECAFHNNQGTGVNVHRGPRTLLKVCNFEVSRESIHLTEGAVATIEDCDFKRNSRGMTLSHAARVEVRSSTFTTQTQHAIRITGNGGEAHIVGNSFRGNTTHGIFLSAEGAVVLVSDNRFEMDACSIFLQETPQAFVYNNCFHACQTGIVFHGAGLCGNVFGNTFEKSQCGCRCEDNATTHLWRNTFEENSEYGIFVTGGATPMVIDNSFLHHTAPGGVALCVCGGGMGKFAFNRYIDNACGAQLEGTGNTPVVNNSTFEGNGVAVRIKEGAAVHVVACTFASSASSDIVACGAIEPDQCVLAYNSFFSKRSTAVTVEENAGVTVYRCIFCGTEGTGVVQRYRGKGLVHECLFYELACGVRIAEGGGGNIKTSSFIHCTTAVEVCPLGCGHFHSCTFLACPTGAPVLVSVHHSSTPTFQQCRFVGWSEMLHPLLHSSGGGLVEDSSFVAGDISVLLDGGCEMTLRRNTFLRGVIGVRFNPRSQAKVVQNTFCRHALAAVNLMDNAAGELQENEFAQPLESGGILVGSHNVLVDANNILENPPARAVKELADRAGLESSLIASFADCLSPLPHWARHGMGETPHASVLPSPILTVMSTPETAEEGEEAKATPEAENKAKEKVEGDATQKAARRPPARRVEGSKPVRKGGKKTVVEVFSFPLSDTTVSVPQGVRETLERWVEMHGVTLVVEETARCPVPEPMRQICDNKMLQDVSENLSAAAAAQNAVGRGNFAENEPNETRGAAMPEPSPNGSKNAPSTHSQHDTRKSSRESSDLKILAPVKRVLSPESAPCSRLATRAGASKGSQVVRQVRRRRRRILPPPLKSCSQNAQPTRQPIRGPIVTLAGRLRECAVETKRKAKKKENREQVHVDASSVTGLAIFCDEDTQRSSSSAWNGKEQHSGTISLPPSGTGNVSRSGNDDDNWCRSGVESLSRVSVPVSLRSTVLDAQTLSQFSGHEGIFTRPEDSAPTDNGVFKERVSVSSRSCSQCPLDWRSTSHLKSPSKSRGSVESRTGIAESKMATPETDCITRKAHEQGANRSGSRSHSMSSGLQSLSADDQGTRFKKKATKAVLGATQINDEDDDDGAPGKRSAPLKEGRYGTRRQKDREGEHADEGEMEGTMKKKKLTGQGSRQTMKKIRKHKMATMTSGGKNGGTNAPPANMTRTGTSHGNATVRTGTQYPMALPNSAVFPSDSEGYRAGEDSATAARAMGTSATKATPSSTPSPGTKGGVGETSDPHAGFHPQHEASVSPERLGSSAESPRVKKGGGEGRLGSAQLGEPMKRSHHRSGTAAPRPSGESREIVALENWQQPKGASVLSASASESKSADSLLDSFRDFEKRVENRGSLNSTMVTLPEQRPTTATMPSSEIHGGEHASERGSERKEGQPELEENDDVHPPKVTASLLQGPPTSRIGSTANKTKSNHSHNNRISDYGNENCDAGNALEGSAVPSLSEKGRALLGVLGDTVLHDDAVLQEHVRIASAGSSRRKSMTSGGYGAAVLSSDDSGIQQRTKMTEPAAPGGEGGGGRGGEAKGKDADEDDEKEEMEDIIAILRWLVHLREQRLLTRERFTKAVDCIRANTNVPFFLSEGSRAGDAPTLMVRLPQTADEAITVPLLETPMDVRRRMQCVKEEKNSSPQSQKRELGLVRGVTGISADFKQQNLPWLHRMASDEAREADATRGLPVAAQLFRKNRPPLPLAPAKLPHSHRKGREEALLALEAENKSWSLSQSSLQAPSVLNVSKNRSPAGAADSAVGPLHRDNGKQGLSLLASLRKARHNVVTSFNPAIPKETSPYNKSPRVAAFIAVGTVNFMA